MNTATDTSTASPGLAGKAVLIIDDDPGMLRALEKVLGREGCIVSRATWVRNGIEQLRDHPTPFDLVITDLRMPMASGMTILQAMRIAHPTVPVIVITAFGSPDLQEDWWLEQGAAAYLEKPLDSARLLQAVRHALSGENRK